MKLGLVIPVGPDRLENLAAVMESVRVQTVPPEGVVIVLDGAALEDADHLGDRLLHRGMPFSIAIRAVPKHEPGMEQPRNVGVRILTKQFPQCDHVAFLDSDVIVGPDWHQKIIEAHEAIHEDSCNGLGAEVKDRIIVCPYDWMPPEQRAPLPELRNDPRWPSFDQYDPNEVLREDLAAGLACFSGNLVWPIRHFIHIGGFWSEIHHGRCEDGELGLRAVALGIPISFAREARGWHLWHPVNMELAQARNTRDVPMLNERHPWVQGEGLHVVPQDGRRFNVTCSGCRQSINTIEMWAHAEACPQVRSAS